MPNVTDEEGLAAIKRDPEYAVCARGRGDRLRCVAGTVVGSPDQLAVLDKVDGTTFRIEVPADLCETTLERVEQRIDLTKFKPKVD